MEEVVETEGREVACTDHGALVAHGEDLSLFS